MDLSVTSECLRLTATICGVLLWLVRKWCGSWGGERPCRLAAAAAAGLAKAGRFSRRLAGHAQRSKSCSDGRRQDTVTGGDLRRLHEVPPAAGSVARKAPEIDFVRLSVVVVQYGASAEPTAAGERLKRFHVCSGDALDARGLKRFGS